MLRKIYHALTIFIAFAIICILALNLFTVNSNKKTVKVGFFPLDGFYNVDTDGNYSGYGFDYLYEIAKYTGWNYEFVPTSSQECEMMLENGDLDLLGFVYDSAENQDNYALSEASAGTVYSILTTLKGNDSYNKNDIYSYDGMRIGIYKFNCANDELTDLIRTSGLSVTIKEYYSIGSQQSALENGEVDAIFINNFSLMENHDTLIEFPKDTIRFAANKDDEALVREIDAAISNIKEKNPDFEQMLFDRYYPLPESTYSKFNNTEQAFAQNSNTLNAVLVDAQVPMFYGQDSSGMISDYINIISEKSGLDINLTSVSSYDEANDMIYNNRADIVCVFPYDYTLAQEYGFTPTVPYMTLYFDIVRSKNNTNPDTIIAMIKGDYFNNYVINAYPYAGIMYYDTPEECFYALKNNEANLTFDNSYSSGYFIKKIGLESDVITESFGLYEEGISLAVSANADSTLVSVLNKAINSISEAEHSGIISKNAILTADGSDNSDLEKASKFTIIMSLIGIAVLLLAGIILFTKIRSSYTKKISENKHYDSLTGARNLNKFLADSQELIDKNKELKYAIVVSNFKNFKYINEMYGYDEGNYVLKYLADTIDILINKNEVFGRLNGDNFIILMSYYVKDDLPQRLSVLKNRMINFERSIKENYTVNMVAGIFCIEDAQDNLSLKEIVERANIAQITTSNTGDLDFGFYEEQMRINILRENEIVKNMKSALKNGEFHVYLQPQHYIQQNDVILSAEALVRWIKPDGKIVSPGDFIPLFEKNGFVVDLDRYVFEQVCKFVREQLDRDSYLNISIAVNVSRTDLYQRDFTTFYASTKDAYDIPNDMIELEFTESIVFDDYNTFKKIMIELKSCGFKCSLDDFGAGSSSLNVLKELPVDVLKMDRLFFTSREDEQRNNSVIASVVAMARGLGMKIIAEGIEDIDQVKFLRKIGCDIVQGFIFSKPMPIEKFTDYVATFSSYYPPDIPDEYSEIGAPFDLNDQVNMKVFLSILKFINAVVFSIDLDNGAFKIRSYGKYRTQYPYNSGDYSAHIRNYAKNLLNPEYEEVFLNHCSLQSIISYFYRGDEKIYFEFEAKISSDDEEYVPFCATILKLYNGSTKKLRALLFVQELKWAENNVNSEMYSNGIFRD